MIMLKYTLVFKYIARQKKRYIREEKNEKITYNIIDSFYIKYKFDIFDGIIRH